MLPLLDATYIEKQLLFARRRSQTNCFFFPSHLLFNFELECLISPKRRNFLLLLLLMLFVGICHFRNTQRNCSAQVFFSLPLPLIQKSPISHPACHKTQTNASQKNVLLQIVFLRVSSIISQKNWNSKFMAGTLSWNHRKKLQGSSWATF